MEKLYGQSVHWFAEKIIKFVAVVIFFVIFSFFFLWLAHEWATIPIVYKSVSQNKIVKVTKANGKILPLAPLPQKYEIISVK